MSVENLISTLEKLERMHKSLLELANKKTDFIKTNDMEQLDNMLKTEQAHVAAIETLEQQRQAMVTDYLQAKGIALTGIPTVVQVIDATDGPEKQALQKVRERLLVLLTDLKKRNDLNQKLVFQSLQFVNLTLDMLRPQHQQASTFNYSGAEVRGETTVAKKSYYDSQA
ncbi:flagellar protein FlgN [Lysinibacillus sp. KU-BSD001]|uniref:flagellar protein FlgN n=1 Tax=Lysinibacillus sp. KU-BSD001 TaxID=3141328 RepID=UPI0036EFFEAB